MKHSRPTAIYSQNSGPSRDNPRGVAESATLTSPYRMISRGASS